jgi:PleD family two-component response regulator
VLLSFAMAERIANERRLRYEAQEETIKITRRLNAELEKRVEERTTDLATLNQKLEALSHTDQLTQLSNRRFFEHAGAEEWKRFSRYQQPLSLVVMDVDYVECNAKQIEPCPVLVESA